MNERFKPALGLANGHLQTIFPTLFSKSHVSKIEREIFELVDGDFVECLWYQKPKVDEKRPIITLFHGLAGSFDSPYIQRAMHRFAKAGFSVVVMHFRGCGKEPNRLPRSYHSGDTGDAKAWIEHLQKTYHDTPLYAIGYSLGGNMLLKLLGEWGDASALEAAIAVSVPMQLESSANKMNSGFSRLYQYRLMKALNKSLEEKYNYHDIEKLIGLKKEEVKNLSNFWEFDDAYTAPIHGFKDAKEYYAKSSSKQYLKDITTKTLIVHAFDDPFMSEDVIPTEEELSPTITFELYPCGGHVGFVAGTIFKPHYWLETRILNFLDTIRKN